MTDLRAWLWRQSVPVAVLLAAIAIGATVALAASGPATSAALAGPSRAGRSPATALRATASPISTPTPGPRKGRLSGPVDVTLLGNRVLLADASQAFLVDGAAATPVGPPAGAQGIVLAAKNPDRQIAGGSAIQVSDDGGKNWRAPRAAPPGRGPYVPLMIDPDDQDVWFWFHAPRLLRTRDGGASWRELTEVPDLSAPRMTAGAKAGEQILVDGTMVVVLDDNGARVTVRKDVPGPVRGAVLLGTTLLATVDDGRVFGNTGSGWSVAAGVSGSLVAGSADHAWVGDGTGGVGTAGRVMASTDGNSWTSASGLPRDQSVTGLGSDRGGVSLLAYCAGGDLYRSADGGATFTLLSSALRATG